VSGAELVRGWPPPGVISGEVVLSIGSFDGVHRGHQRLARRVAAGAARRDGVAVVVTFDPHPRCVVDPSGCPPMLTTPLERAQLLAGAGVERVVALPFTQELSTWSAARFCDELLASLNVRRIVAGPRMALGHRREGDERFLREYGAAHGFDVVTVAPAVHRGAPVSSTRVRAALRGGLVGDARAMLGRNYAIPGVVETGERRGRELGFPTANIATASERCIPADGVYATWLLVDGRRRPSATSIGVRPTFGEGRRTIEAHVIDYAGDLYGREVKLEFVSRLREERPYSNAQALIRQMQRDVDRVRQRLSTGA